jgi:hypothetical protein
MAAKPENSYPKIRATVPKIPRGRIDLAAHRWKPR